MLCAALEPGTAAEWTEGGFETNFRTYDKNSTPILKPVRRFLDWGGGGGWFYTILYSTLLCSTLLYSTILYYTLYDYGESIAF